ncbi:MAG: TldD/PmbA family protein, partial [Candidatus Hermodarchaeia archaeon]
STGGWEIVQALDLPGNALRVAEESVALLSADTCPTDLTTNLVLGGSQLALQIHESCGHPTELDRVYGTEAAYAGTSFLTTEKLGTFQYGSEVVNLTQDSIRSHGLGTFGWDDEGVPAQSTPLVKEGMFVGYLMSRETASRLGLESNGCMRASGWNRIPLVRMTNVSLEPGTWDFDDLIADTGDGIFMETNRSWSIDDKRYNFQFGTEVGYEIKNGELGRLLKNCTYTGITPEFWNNCDAVCNHGHWHMWGTPNCGKGQPSQVAHTGHGAAPARFRNVRVGVMK